MEKEIPLYESIYNKIVNRILVGIYPKGYQLSSIQTIHTRSKVGYTSIRRALGLLEQNGFIRQEARRRPTVIFDLEEPRCRELRQKIFLSHLRAHLDCYRAIPFLIPGLVTLGSKKCTPQLLEALESLCAQGEDQFTNRYELLILAYTWQSLVVQQAENSLAADLFVQIRGFDELRFTTLPSAGLVPGEVRATLRTLRYWTELLRRGALEDLHTMSSLFCIQAMCCLEHSLSPLIGPPEFSTLRQVEFRWYVHQSPMPLYKKIAYDLLRTACLEGMGPGDCFPSEAVLMERYNVAAVTVRGAVALLSELGIAQPVNGVGTLFTGARADTPEAAPYLQEARASLEILSACSYSLATEIASPLSPETGKVLREELSEIRFQEGIGLWLLRKLVSLHSSDALQAVFEQLETRYIFGLYASGLPSRPGRQEDLDSISLQAEGCLELLEAGDQEGFARRLQLLFQEMERELRPLP